MNRPLLICKNKDINLKVGRHGMILVQAKTVNGEYWESKTKVNRAIPISSRLRVYLDNYTPEKVDGGWFFPSPKGETLGRGQLFTVVATGE